MRDKVKIFMRRYGDIPYVSALLVIINLVIFLVCTFTGSMLYSIGRSSVNTVLIQKEYGRIIWSMFLHGDVSHLFNNMLLVFFMGSMIEKEVGHIRYGVFYFLSGIGGGILSLVAKVMTNDIWTGSIGASGAVFGLDGVLLSLVLFSNRNMPTATPAKVGFVICYSLYNGFTGHNIDNAAHVGGLLTGFLAGTIMCIIERRKSDNRGGF